MKFLKFSSIILFLFIVSSFSCNKEEADDLTNGDYMLFGHFFGMCVGDECINIYKISDGKLYEDNEDNYPKLEAYSGNFNELSEEQYELAEGLYEKVPSQLKESDSQTFGSPDAYDQGGYYIEIRRGSSIRYWMIDKDKQNVPEYLHIFMEDVRLVLEAL